MRGTVDIDPALVTPVTMQFAAECPGYALSRVTVRDHVVTIDEPAERGGTNEGPTPTETFVSSLVGVTNVILRRIAKRDGIAIRSLSVTAEAELDRRGVWLVEPVTVPWRAIAMALTIDTDADEAQLAVWEEDLQAFSPIHALLRAGGTPVTLAWRRA
ncbi:OsmC family protein [uncultured Alsobacter sp.]|uniref:OsmC family protein n=1 Tax=uncultured Alsobacter sp. TaxID=1748258 RepID=UPI0025E9AB73|nr:OsmC family protein [uncultured Alsobacter sp.]